MIRTYLKAQSPHFPVALKGASVSNFSVSVSTFYFYFLGLSFLFACLTAVMASFLFSFSLAHAQTPNSVDGINIVIDPSNPAPGQSVDISIQDYLSDISSAHVTWAVNGQKAADGIGKNDIQVTAPALGKKSNISILIQTVNGQNIQKSIMLKSGSVDMIWESEGYAPPLYGGKQDFAYQNTIKVVAMPHLANSSGVEIDPSALVYSWKQDSNAIADQSGYGKQAIVITSGIVPRPTSIDVTVSTRDGSQTASGVITLHPDSPSIVFYKDDPLYGVLYNLALGSQAPFTNQEMTLLAAPISFTMPSLSKNNLEYDWTINGVAQSNLTGNRSVTLRVQDTSRDSNYPVQLQIQNKKDILQGMSNGLTVMFIASKQNNGISL